MKVAEIGIDMPTDTGAVSERFATTKEARAWLVTQRSTSQPQQGAGQFQRGAGQRQKPGSGPPGVSPVLPSQDQVNPGKPRPGMQRPGSDQELLFSDVEKALNQIDKPNWFSLYRVVRLESENLEKELIRFELEVEEVEVAK
jgi:hypothetical protein